MLEPINTELAELEAIREKWNGTLIQIDRHKAIRVHVTTENVDLDMLRARRQALREMKEARPPTERELIEFGKAVHPYYVEDMNTSLAWIEAELNGDNI